jgi:hypothetical protein
MPDFVLRGIESALAERIKSIARERNWSINDVILYLVKVGLGEAEEFPVEHVARDIAHLGGTWAPDESSAFRQALEAFERLPESDTPFGSGGTKSGRGPA